MLFKENRFLLFILCLVALINSKTVSAQQWSWVLNAGGNNQTDVSDKDIAVDNTGTQFVAGYFEQTITLGPFTLSTADNYYSDMYLAKIDSAGHVIWAKMIDLGSTYDDALSICLDDSDNVFVTGAYNGKIFACKYDSSGQLKWNSNINQKNFYGYGTDIGLDQYENVYITGKQNGSAIVAKLNWEGDYQWSSTIQGCHSNGAWGNDLAVDRLGNCYMAGGFDCDSLVIGNKVFKRNDRSYRTILVKYSPKGQLLWATMPDGPTNGTQQVALSDSGYVMLSASFGNQIVFNNQITVYPMYGITSFLAKYDANGNIIWARNGGRYESTSKDMVFDYDGNLYYGGISFGNWGGTEMDFHLVKYTPTGNIVFQREVLVGHEYVYGLDIDNFGNLYHIGHADVKGIGVIGLGYVNANTAYVAKLNTGASTRRRPSKPLIDRYFVVCAGSSVPLLSAKGSTIQWYKDSLLANKVGTGNNFQPNSSKTDTFYVTQTVNSIQSWPRQVIVYFSSLSTFSIERKNDSLVAPWFPEYNYQWYLNGAPMPDSLGGKSYSIKMDTTGSFKVVVKDHFLCQQEALFAEVINQDPVTIAPNPAGSILKFTLGKQLDLGRITILIYDVHGNSVYNGSAVIRSNETKEINTISLKPGLYVLALFDGKNNYTSSFIKL